MENIKVFMRGWLGYYAIADMDKYLKDLNSWLRRNTNVYLEAVETTKNESGEFKETWYVG